MSDSTLPSPTMVKLLRFKRAAKTRRSSSQTITKGPNETEPQAEISPEKASQSKDNSEAATLSHLDTTPEIDLNQVKSSKGILKDPKNSIVMKGKAKCESMGSDTSNESKSKKVTFSAEIRDFEIKRNFRCIRLPKKKSVPSNSSQIESKKIETSTVNNLTPMTGLETQSSPRNVFKISRPPRSDPNPRGQFNINLIPLQSNENQLKIPIYEKTSDSDSPTRSFASLHTMLDESPIYPSRHSSDASGYLPQIGSLSARNMTTKSLWRENTISLTPRDGQISLRGYIDKNLDYFAEIMRKAPLVLANTPAQPNSKMGSHRHSKSGSQENIFVISRRDFIKAVMIPHERL